MWRVFRALFLTKPSAYGPKPVRDVRIDCVRGLMLVVIFINHIPGNLLAQYTPSNFTFSDAAEVFVLLAGLSATLSYGRLIEQRGLAVSLLRLGARIGTIYVAHLIVFLMVCGVVFVAVRHTENPLYIEFINIHPFLRDPVNALVDVLTLVYQASYLNILPLYVVLLAMFPVLYLGMRKHPIVTLCLSVLVWRISATQGWNLPDHSGGGGWFFNPFAWQLVFLLGMLMGRALLQGVAMPNSQSLTVMSVLVMLGLSLAYLYPETPWHDMATVNSWLEELHLGNDKMNLAPVRVLHLLSIIWVFCVLVPAQANWLQSRVAKGFAAMGRHALPVFCVATVLAIVGLVVMVETAYAPEIQLAVLCVGITLLFGLGSFLSWYQRQFAKELGAATSKQELKTSPTYSSSS